MPMQELEVRIGLLRLLLADIQGKQAQLLDMEKQYRVQLTRVVEFVVYREGNLDNALNLMAEVQGKLDEVLKTSTHLSMVAGKAVIELEVLNLTKRVAEARSQLGELEQRRRTLSEKLESVVGGEGTEERYTLEPVQVDTIRSINDEVEIVVEEIQRLNTLITEASERAAQTVQSRLGNQS
ncbi:MAG: hypothetical protein M3014_11315 [Chloroflexota bacterium]|nr:hypothetical protein [Chloroflexota bacterium]